MFNPTRPHILYAAFRRSVRLWSWDLRGDPTVPLYCFSKAIVSNESGRNNLTNQKRQFDVESAGKWLASANQVCAHDLLNFLFLAYLFWRLQLGEITVYDLEIESSDPLAGGGEVIDGPRQNGPTLLYHAHGGRSIAYSQVVFQC